jgi:hypothetical protein
MPVPRTREADPRKGVITLPGGREVAGFFPGQAGRRGNRPMDLLLADQRGCPATETIEEHQLRDDLARQVVGLTEVRLPLGFADVMTGEAVFEVEPRHSWQDGARQALAYACQCGLPPALALFRAISAREMRGIFTKLQAIGLPAIPGGSISLWWWTGQAWQQITSLAQCADMPHRASFGSCRYCGSSVAWPDGSLPGYDYDPRWAIREMHCCEQLCPAEHENVDGCLYWLAQRAFPARSRLAPVRPAARPAKQNAWTQGQEQTSHVDV